MNPVLRRWALVASAMLMVAVQNAAIAQSVSWPQADPAAIANWWATRFAMNYIVLKAEHDDGRYPACDGWHPAVDLSVRKIPLNIHAEASNVYHQMTGDYGPQFAFDGNDKTRWATDDGTSQAWISADLGSARSIHGVRIHEAYAGRVQNYELQYRDDTTWQTFLTGATLGADFEATFPAIKAREFRLNILSAKQAPTIQEIEWF